jgi:NAD(P)-dependent dehydrogenase (short-subunit alcohol dehydrogenase family)
VTTRLDGRRIIVTGGASGMGAGLVRGLPALGARLVSLDVAAEQGAAVAAAADVPFLAADLTDEAQVQRAIDTAAQHLGGVDVLIHAAGVAPAAPAETTPLALWRRVMDINATSTFLTNQAVFPHLREHGGAILNFSSAAGVKGLPRKSAYSASKGAVLAWTRTVAREWGRYGITVNAVVPAIWTPMFDRTRSELDPEQLADLDEQLARTIPIGGRLGRIEQDFVPFIAYYASAGAGFVTGQALAIDGGQLTAG